MRDVYFLGIDNGGTFSKAAIFDTKGNEISVSSRKVEIIRPHKGLSERNALKIWDDTASAIHETIFRSGISPADIIGVGCTGHGNGLYVLDSDGNPLRNAIYSNDERAAGYIHRWKEQGLAQKVLPVTTQSLWAAQPNALLAWMKDQEHELYQRIASVQMVKDYIRFRLTGEVAAEITDMSGTSLMNVVSGSYDVELLSWYGIAEAIDFLPPLISSTAVAGYVSAAAAQATGLPEGIPVAGGMFDIDACALSSGLIDSGPFSIVAGTWGNNQYISQKALIDEQLFMNSCYCIPGWYLILEGSPTSAGNLEWIVDRFFTDEKKSIPDYFEWMSQQVEQVRPEESGLIFLPFIYGNHSNDRTKSVIYGMEVSTTKAEVLRSVFEGVIFSHLTHLERLLSFREKPQTIRITGGAANSDVWCRMFADCMNIPVEIPRGSELGALGAAMAAAVSAQYYRNLEEAMLQMTAVEKRYEPDQTRHRIYMDKYQKYQHLIQSIILQG